MSAISTQKPSLLSVTKAPKKDGKGYESIRYISIPSGMKWLKKYFFL